MCLNKNGLDYLRSIVYFDTTLCRKTILQLMAHGISQAEIAFYSGEPLNQINEKINKT